MTTNSCSEDLFYMYIEYYERVERMTKDDRGLCWMGEQIQGIVDNLGSSEREERLIYLRRCIETGHWVSLTDLYKPEGFDIEWEIDDKLPIPHAVRASLYTDEIDVVWTCRGDIIDAG